MVDVTDLESNVLEFLRKNFAFARLATVGDREYAVFQRTETESESQFRPRILRLSLVVPADWVLHDLAADLLVLGRDGHTPGPRGTGTAVEAAAQTQEFVEQGIPFRRRALPGGWLYVPADSEGSITDPTALAALGIPGPVGGADR